VFSTLTSTLFADQDLARKLQEMSVTIKSNNSQGSGVIFTREVSPTKDSTEKEKINFVWTAAHVVENLRSTREVIDSDGRSRTVVEFKEPSIVKELIESGRRVGELEMDAKVIKYSDAKNGHDLALLMLRKRNFVDVSAKFHLEEPGILPAGTRLFHVGSLYGQVGANSLTTGIISQVGRVISLGNGDRTIFDQTTATAFPGSSGGGVFIADLDGHEGEYCGMLVRGSGETFNLIVPIRRMKKWANEVEIGWAIDPKIPVPPLSEILKIDIEDIGVKFDSMKAENYRDVIPKPLIKIED